MTPSLKGDHYGFTLRLADWDADGDVDVLASDAGSIWFHERLPGDAFRKHELLNLTEFTPRKGQSRFEVADWDSDPLCKFDSTFIVYFGVVLYVDALHVVLFFGGLTWNPWSDQRSPIPAMQVTVIWIC